MPFRPPCPLLLRNRRWADLVCLSLCTLSLAFLLFVNVRPPKRDQLEVTALKAADGRSDNISGSGFFRGAVYPETLTPPTHGAIQFYGSWIGSDQSVGSAQSVWYDTKPNTYICIAGYPSHAGIELRLETTDGSLPANSSRLVLKPDPGLTWQLLELPFQSVSPSTKFRLVAVDQSREWRGWVAFSTPFVLSSKELPYVSYQLLLVFLAASAAITMFLSPGLLLRDLYLRWSNKLLPFIWIPVPGLLGASILGLLSWAGPSWASGTLISTLGLGSLFFYSIYSLLRTSIHALTSRAERKALLVIVLLTAVATAKSIYSVSPAGELYEGTISRTLEVGDRSDSRISFHVVQLVALRERPRHAVATRLFGPWDFSSRGPLVGLAASPFVLASHARVPASLPDQPWMVFDPEGFMAYRIAMIAVATSCLLIVFGLSVYLMPEEWALMAFLVTVTAPFVIHEVYFTWPKLESASFVLLAVYLILRSRWFGAGLALGVGYFCHASALLTVPALLGLIPLSKTLASEKLSLPRKLSIWASRAGIFLFGVAMWIVLWRLVNRHHFDQAGFLDYIRQADQKSPTITNWLQSRLDSLLNTLVPLNVLLFHGTHSGINSIYDPSPLIVRFFFQCWTGLPFGIGIVYYFCLLRLGALALKKVRWLTSLLCVLPLAIFTVYWGPVSTGMLREGLHAWFLGVSIGSVLVLRTFAAADQFLFRFVSWALLFRGIEILSMLLLPAIWSQHKWVQHSFVLSDLVALSVIFVGTAWLVTLSFLQSQSLRAPQATPAPRDERFALNAEPHNALPAIKTFSMRPDIKVPFAINGEWLSTREKTT